MYNQLRVERYKMWRFTPLYGCMLFYLFSVLYVILGRGMNPQAIAEFHTMYDGFKEGVQDFICVFHQPVIDHSFIDVDGFLVDLQHFQFFRRLSVPYPGQQDDRKHDRKKNAQYNTSERREILFFTLTHRFLPVLPPGSEVRRSPSSGSEYSSAVRHLWDCLLPVD